MKTKYFGDVSFSKDEIITFDQGMFGFEEYKQFIIINFEKDKDVMINLQSTEDENISFVLMNPFYLREDYQAELLEQEAEALDIDEDTKGVLYYVVCVVKDEIKNSTVNLKSPIVINPESKKGIQILLDNSKYGFKHPLSEFSIGGK